MINWLEKGKKLSEEYIQKAKDKPGGSNVGKYPSNWDFAGPSGGAPKGSYPINNLHHAKSALKLAHHAPNPEGIKNAVYRKFPQLKKQDGGQILYQMGGAFGAFQSGGKTIKNIVRNDDGKPILDKDGKFVYMPQSGRAELTPLSEDPIFNILSLGSGLIKGGAKSLASIPKNLNFASGKGIWLPKKPRPTYATVAKGAAIDIAKILNPFFGNGGKINWLQKGGNVDLYNRLNPREEFGPMSFLNNGIQYLFGQGKPRKGFNLATPEEEAYWKLYNKVPQTEIKSTNVRINTDKGDIKSEFVGIPESMKERIAAMADTLNLGKIVRNPESFRTRFPNSPINYNGLKRDYKFAKQVMNNPGKGQQAKEIYSIKPSPIGNTGLGALEDFGLVWDKDKKVLKAYDTYDFPPILNFVIPKRDKELKIRDEIPFDPTIGSRLLKDNLKNWDQIK